MTLTVDCRTCHLLIRYAVMKVSCSLLIDRSEYYLHGVVRHAHMDNPRDHGGLVGELIDLASLPPEC